MPKRKLLPVGYMIPVPDMIAKLRQVFKNIRAVRPDLIFHGIRIVAVMVQYDLGKQADSGRALLFFPLGIRIGFDQGGDHRILGNSGFGGQDLGFCITFKPKQG